MNVKELKEAINNLPDDMEVIIQKDAEGNDYSPLSGVDPDAVYISHNTWRGIVYSLAWSAEDACLTEEEWDIIRTKPPALILHPVN